MPGRLFVLICLTHLMGCAVMPWTMMGGGYYDEALKVQVELPQSWMRSNRTQDALWITRDGILLQSIAIERLALDKALPHTKKTFTRGMLPQEVADIELDELRSNRNMLYVEVLENTPRTIDGHPGFKMVYTSWTEDGLRIKHIHYGVLLEDGVYRIRYRAPLHHYFDKDLGTFERLLASMRFSAKG